MIAVQGLKLDGKNWTFSYRIAGKARRMKIGTAPLLVPADARRAAQRLAGMVAMGICPASERKASRRREVAALAPVRDTIEKVAAQYLKFHRQRVRPSTYRESTRVFTVEILPAWRPAIRNLPSGLRGLTDRIARCASVGKSMPRQPQGVAELGDFRRRNHRSLASRRYPAAGARSRAG